MKTISAAVALLLFGGVHTEVSGAEPEIKWDYNDNGADWDEKFPDCGKPGQSPIDLKRDSVAYPNHDIKKDKFERKYENERDQTIKWTKMSNKVTLKDGVDGNVPVNTSFFQSELGKQVYGGNTNMWKANQFHFHTQSEHTVDGARFDLEMQTFHKPNPTEEEKAAVEAGTPTKLAHAAMGILFSVKNFTVKLTRAEQLVIDTFFETLDLADKSDPKVNLITYGNLMNMMDMNSRWIYQGSVTTPPCATNVYWNVLDTIYPITQQQLLLFKDQQDRDTEGKLKDTGNWRTIQEYNTQNAQFVTKTNFGSEMDSSNEINHNISVKIYNQNVITNAKCEEL